MPRDPGRPGDAGRWPGASARRGGLATGSIHIDELWPRLRLAETSPGQVNSKARAACDRVEVGVGVEDGDRLADGDGGDQAVDELPH
jgi:hypothetical protein